jgi:hypothetical protein
MKWILIPVGLQPSTHAAGVVSENAWYNGNARQTIDARDVKRLAKMLNTSGYVKKNRRTTCGKVK